MADFDINSLKEVGGIFRFGSGVLGKSAIALGVLLIAIIICVSRLHSDTAILIALIIGVLLFAGWFWYVLDFAGKHPDVALLEGAEWSGYQRFQSSAKGYLPPSSEQQPTLPPAHSLKVLDAPTTPDEEQG